MHDRISEKTNIVIYGYDYGTAEKIIDSYTAGTGVFTSIYINDGVHREDRLLCHLKIGGRDLSPYIGIGTADIVRAASWEDAGRYLDWIRDGGRLEIDTDIADSAAGYAQTRAGRDIEGGETDAARDMRDYIIKQERAGIIHIVYLGTNML